MSTEGVPQAILSFGDTGREAPFYIPATGPSTRPRRTLKHGDSFAVLDSHGDIGTVAGGTDGLFAFDTRFLARLEFRLQGLPLLLLGSNLRDDNSVLSIDLTNPDIYDGGRIVLEKDTIHVVRTIFLWRGTAYQRFGVTNHGERPVQLELALEFGNDFADLFEVRGLKRTRRGTARTRVIGGNEVVLRYEGLDGRVRRTVLLFEPDPTKLTNHSAAYWLKLDPKERRPIYLSVGCIGVEGTRPLPFLKAMVAARRALKAATKQAATVQTSNEVFNEVLCRAMADLYMLMTETPEGRYPYAGIPWYSTTFGRDGLITALQMLWFDPNTARGVLRRLAAHQAATNDALSDAEPGKILHEMRAGEMAALREVPFELYYGSVDATPLFVLLAGLYLERTGDEATLVELWPAIDAALRWIDGPGDPDRDGFIEYHRMTDKGLANQGWKDSHDAIFHADGRLAGGPIALAEVQGYVYAAKELAAACARRLGHDERAAELAEAAQQLAKRFEAAFWCEDIGTYALALDGETRRCAARTSNAGQLLFTGIVRPDRARKVTDQLLKSQFFSGWGIRTVAGTERRYNPMSYHNGSIWPHDNALIALGFARYGFQAAVARVFTGLFDAASYMELRRLPELFCGFQRRRGRGPTLYPVACAPQAWAAGAPFLLLQASLGLQFDTAQCAIRLCNPRLPDFLNEVVLRNLCLGEASADLAVRRHGANVSVEVLRSDGGIDVSVVYAAQPPVAGVPNSAGPG